MKKSFLALFASLLICTLFSSCYTPSPLYGKWTDNENQSINFINDGTFVASIIDDTTHNKITYQGEYTVMDNVLVFNVKDPITSDIVTEWDIRGSMLYITWTTSNYTKSLTLYHSAK